MHFVAPGVASRVLRAQSNTYSELICRGVKHEESSLCGCLLSVHYIRWCSENNKVSLRMCPNNGAHATEILMLLPAYNCHARIYDLLGFWFKFYLKITSEIEAVCGEWARESRNLLSTFSFARQTVKYNAAKTHVRKRSEYCERLRNKWINGIRIRSTYTNTVY